MNTEKTNTISQKTKLGLKKQDGKSSGIELSEDRVKEMIEISKEKVLKETKNEIARQLQESKTSFMIMFGIFASIALFVTTEIKFLEKIKTVYQVIGFTFVFLASLLSFNIALDYLANCRIDKKTIKPTCYFYCFVIGLFFVGICFVLAEDIISILKCLGNK